MRPITILAILIIMHMTNKLTGAEAADLMLWTNGAPRAEIAPTFARAATGGRDGSEVFSITCDQRDGLQGWWIRNFPVVGDGYVRFRAYSRSKNVTIARRSVFARLLWANEKTGDVRPPLGAVRREAPSIFPHDIQLYGDRSTGMPAMDEFPPVQPVGPDGWCEVSGVYLVPTTATRVAVELNLQFAPGGSVEWSTISIEPVAQPTKRTARLAAVNFEPSGGKVPLDNCRMAEPFIAKAAAQGADLVVLSEHFTTQGLDPSYSTEPHVTSAEPIPGGPLCAFFGELAKKNNIYIVVGMYEHEGLCVYNDAVMFGPDGGVSGKYRKTTPTSGEMGKGIKPGTDYPVFSTRFGRVGLLVCYDLQFPEPARELTMHGAEIIAAPAYGFQTVLGQARAIENQIYLVTSIYEDDGVSEPLHRWGISGVIDPEGVVVARAPAPHTVVVTEVDLTPRHWVWLGNWRERLPNHVPIVPAER